VPNNRFRIALEETSMSIDRSVLVFAGVLPGAAF
jgi:hypothetical protein